MEPMYSCITPILVYLNGNNAAEGENNIKYANSYPPHALNCEELICTRHLNRYNNNNNNNNNFINLLKKAFQLNLQFQISKT